MRWNQDRNKKKGQRRRVVESVPIPSVDGPQAAHAVLSEYADLPCAIQEVQE